MMKSDPGTYALILGCDTNTRVQVGRWGEIELRPGYYIYVGSAFGSGGIKALVSRHWLMHKRKHWHIDYLREYVSPMEAWISYKAERLEHKWAQVFYDMSVMTPIQGFGCSDCKCCSHLFNAAKLPRITAFRPAIENKIEEWSI